MNHYKIRTHYIQLLYYAALHIITYVYINMTNYAENMGLFLFTSCTHELLVVSNWYAKADTVPANGRFKGDDVSFS